MNFFVRFGAVVALLATRAYGVTLTSTSSAYTVNAESTNAFQFTVSRTSCDITSIKYLSQEVQYPSTGSHISSGLGTATVSATTITGRTLPMLDNGSITDILC